MADSVVVVSVYSSMVEYTQSVRNQWCSMRSPTLHLTVLVTFLIRVQSLKSFPVSHTTLSGVTTQVVDQEFVRLVVTTLTETMVLSHLVSQLMKFQELQNSSVTWLQSKV